MDLKVAVPFLSSVSPSYEFKNVEFQTFDEIFSEVQKNVFAGYGIKDVSPSEFSFTFYENENSRPLYVGRHLENKEQARNFFNMVLNNEFIGDDFEKNLSELSLKEKKVLNLLLKAYLTWKK